MASDGSGRDLALERRLGSSSQRSLEWWEVERISEERLSWTLRSLEREALMVIAARAVMRLDLEGAASALSGYASASDVGARVGEIEPALRARVERFCNHARQGHFRDEVPYRGVEESRGTQEFVARCRMYFERCVAAAADRASAADVRAAFEALLALLHELDDDPDEIVHFAEGDGSAGVGVRWPEILPAYFRVLACTAGHTEFESHCDRALTWFVPDIIQASALRTQARAAWAAEHPS